MSVEPVGSADERSREAAYREDCPRVDRLVENPAQRVTQETTPLRSTGQQVRDPRSREPALGGLIAHVLRRQEALRDRRKVFELPRIVAFEGIAESVGGEFTG